MKTTYKHTIVRIGPSRIGRQLVWEFTSTNSFGKLALLKFREFVRNNFPDAEIEAPIGTPTGFRYRLSGGDTLELK
jgi:hypothetical protein